MRWKFSAYPQWRVLLVLVAAAAFSGFLLLNLQSLNEERKSYADLFRTNSWMAWQIEKEYIRFLLATGLLGEAPSADSHDNALFRFDILLSRIPAVLTGAEAALLREVPGVVEMLTALDDTLHDLDEPLATVELGDPAQVLERSCPRRWCNWRLVGHRRFPLGSGCNTNL